MRIKLKNNSIWQVVGTDNVDRLVGSNVIGCVFSEYSLQDPRAWDYVRPILAENGGWALFIYTARGRNHGYDLYSMATKNKNWFAQLLTVDDTKRPDGSPVISQEAIEDERAAGMPEEMVQQEFWCSFDAPLVGSYYGSQMAAAMREGRITNLPWDPKLDVHTAWDLGIDDSMSIWFFQIYGGEIRFVNYYENSGEAIPHYIKVLKELPYVYGEHYAPHDITVRSLNDGKTRWETAKGLGVKMNVGKRMPIEDGIEAVRNMLPRCYFDAENCARGIEGLRQYRKEWDDARKVFSSTAVKDWTCHPADAFRTMAMGIKEKIGRGKARPRLADNNYYILGN
jgi:hypothetical protein